MVGAPAESHSARIFLGSERGPATVGIGEVENVEMSMRLDTARDDDFAAGAYRTAGLRGRIVDTDEFDPLTLDADRPLPDPLRSHYQSIASDHIQHLTLASPS